MNIDALEKLARFATPGPWTAMGKPSPSFSDHGWRAMATCGPLIVAVPKSVALTVENGIVTKSWSNDDNAAYIAAASPDQVLKLIAVCRAAQEWADVADSPIEDMERATKARDALRSALAALKDKPND